MILCLNYILKFLKRNYILVYDSILLIFIIKHYNMLNIYIYISTIINLFLVYINLFNKINLKHYRIHWVNNI